MSSTCHLHGLLCVCDECAADPSLKKVASITRMVSGGGTYDDAVFLAECSERKVRLLHKARHNIHTREQRAMQQQ